MSNKSYIVVTGGSGRFGLNLKKLGKKNYKFPSKNQLNILKKEDQLNARQLLCLLP